MTRCRKTWSSELNIYCSGDDLCDSTCNDTQTAVIRIRMNTRGERNFPFFLSMRTATEIVYLCEDVTFITIWTVCVCVFLLRLITPTSLQTSKNVEISTPAHTVFPVLTSNLFYFSLSSVARFQHELCIVFTATRDSIEVFERNCRFSFDFFFFCLFHLKPIFITQNIAKPTRFITHQNINHMQQLKSNRKTNIITSTIDKMHHAKCSIECS